VSAQAKGNERYKEKKKVYHNEMVAAANFNQKLKFMRLP
jgi:hypothetical protein